VSFGSAARVRHAGRRQPFAFADPDARLGYAYVMNKTDFYMFDDPREKALRDAVYRAIAALGTGAWRRLRQRNPRPAAPLRDGRAKPARAAA
jgi:hypothetical protein